MSNIHVSSSTLQKVTVYWDIENCPVPSGFEGYEVVVALRNLALRYGFLHRIVAIANLDQLSKGYRNALQDSGVSMHDISSRKPGAADMAIFIEILKLVLDISPPHVIVLVIGDRDFSKLLNVLVGRGYHLVLLHTNDTCPLLQNTASEHLPWEEFVKMTCVYRAPPEVSQIKPSKLEIPVCEPSQRSPNTQSRRLKASPENRKIPVELPPPTQSIPTNTTTTNAVPTPTFGPLVDYLTLEAQQGRHVVKLCDLGVQKEIPWRNHFLKLKSYIEAAARLGFVTMIYLPNNQIGVCLTDKCHFTLIRKIQKLVQDLPYILEQMKIQFLAPVEQNLQNVVKSRFGFRASPHHWEIFLQCLQCCGYQITGTAGKRSIIGLLGNFEGFDPSEPKHTLKGESLQEFEEFLTNSTTDREGGFTWNSNSGRFGFVTDLLQVGPPLIRTTPSGVLLSHIQIMLNNRNLGYNKENKICRSEFIDQPTNLTIDINNFRQKLESSLAPHSNLLHPLIELQVAAPLVRELWKSLGFSKMKHYLKFAEENGVLLCDWKTREDTSQPWIALTSSIKPIFSAVEAYFDQTIVEHVDANVIKNLLEKKYGYIRSAAWSDILTVSLKYRPQSVHLKKEGENFTFYHKALSDQEDDGSNTPSENLSVDLNAEDNPNSPPIYAQFNFEELIEEEAPEISFHTDFQNPTSKSLKYYEQSNNDINYDRLSVNSPTSTTDSRKTIGSGLVRNRSSSHNSPNTNSIFQLSPFERTSSSDEESNKPSVLDREGRFSFFHSPPKFLSPPIVIPEINS